MYVYCSAGIMNTVSIVAVEPPVHQRHLELELEVRHRPQPADDDVGPAARHVVDQQPVEGVHFDIAVGLEHARAISTRSSMREQRRLLGVDENRDDDAVEQPRAARDDVDVSVGQRIERARVDGQ